MSMTTGDALRPSKGQAIIKTFSLGAASIGLYFLLYLFSDDLSRLAAATRQGEKLYALVPLIVALIFSFIHGAFTGHFWDLLGLKAKK